MTIQHTSRPSVDADSKESGGLKKTTYRISAPRGYTVQHIQTVRYPGDLDERDTDTTTSVSVDASTASSVSDSTSSTSTSTASSASTASTASMNFPAYISIRPKHVHWADERPKPSRRHSSYYVAPEPKIHTYSKYAAPVTFEERRPIRPSSPRKYQYVEPQPTRVSTRKADRYLYSQRAYQDHREPHVTYRDDAHTYGPSKRERQSCKCRDCGRSFDSSRELDSHQDRNTHYCREHNRCFSDWKTHAFDYAHIKCPRQSCRNRAAFGSPQDCREHMTLWHR